MKKLWIITASVAAIALAGGVAWAQMGDGHPMGSHRMQMMQQMAQGMHGGGMQGGGLHGKAGMHSQHGAKPSATKGDQSPATLAYRGVNTKMHEATDIEFSGNADADFVKSMIPHHQGAVDMAKVVLAFGKDPEVRKLAETIIKSQEDEIGWMKGWLEKNKK